MNLIRLVVKKCQRIQTYDQLDGFVNALLELLCISAWTTLNFWEMNSGEMNYCAHVSFGGAVISIIFVATKVCSDKHVLLRQNFCRLSQQAFFCRDENVFVATKDVFCRDKSMLVATQLLCRQLFYFNSIFCHGKHTFVVAKDVFCRNKSMLVATKNLCRQSFCVCVCVLQPNDARI